MGAAAYNRGSAVIAKVISADATMQTEINELARAALVAEECDIYTRAVMEDMADPRGLRSTTMIRFAAKPKAAKLRLKLIEAHNAWVDAPADTMYRAILSIARARAAHALYSFLLGSFDPKHGIPSPPRCVQ